MKQGRTPYCKVYYSLLALSYLEVVLWSSGLLVSLVCTKPVGTADAQQYLLRETVNLKCVGGQDADELAQLSELEARFDEVCGQCENLCAVAEKQRQQLEVPERSITEYCGLSLTNLEVNKGLPGPYTGVKVIL